MLARRIAFATLVVAGAVSTSIAFAQNSGGTAAAPKGEEVYKRVCAACHNAPPPPPVQMGPLGPPPGGLQARALPPERLKLFSPEAILNALTNGKMQEQAASLSDAERRAAAEYASGQTFSGVKEALAKSLCKKPQPSTAFTASPKWVSWGNGVENSRFQPAE